MRRRYLWVGGVGIAVALVVGGFMLLQDGAAGFLPSGSVPPVSATDKPIDGYLGAAVAPKVTDIPTPPSAIAEKVAEDGIENLSAKDKEAWDKYLAETAAVVAENASGLTARLDAALQAIAASDDEALSTMLAPDEGDQVAFIESLATAYPSIGAAENQDSVGIFCVDEAAVYFGYSVVRWTDGGIDSAHTVAVPMRFIDGTWYITSIGTGTTGLISVQTVRM